MILKTEGLPQALTVVLGLFLLGEEVFLSSSCPGLFIFLLFRLRVPVLRQPTAQLSGPVLLLEPLKHKSTAWDRQKEITDENVIVYA